MSYIRMIISIICLLFISASGFAKDENIYKWIDAKKQVHYGSVPPPGVDAVLITPNSGPSDQAKSEAEAINKSLEQVAGPKESTAAPVDDTAAEAKKQEACDAARAEYEKFSAASGVTVQNDQGGYEQVDEEKRQSMLEERKAAADKACAP